MRPLGSSAAPGAASRGRQSASITPLKTFKLCFDIILAITPLIEEYITWDVLYNKYIGISTF